MAVTTTMPLTIVHPSQTIPGDVTTHDSTENTSDDKTGQQNTTNTIPGIDFFFYNFFIIFFFSFLYSFYEKCVHLHESFFLSRAETYYFKFHQGNMPLMT